MITELPLCEQNDINDWLDDEISRHYDCELFPDVGDLLNDFNAEISINDFDYINEKVKTDVLLKSVNNDHKYVTADYGRNREEKMASDTKIKSDIHKGTDYNDSSESAVSKCLNFNNNGIKVNHKPIVVSVKESGDLRNEAREIKENGKCVIKFIKGSKEISPKVQVIKSESFPVGRKYWKIVRKIDKQPVMPLENNNYSSVEDTQNESKVLFEKLDLDTKQCFRHASDTGESVCDSGDDSGEKSNHCMSKNAIAARENRQKKKKYLENLEQSVYALSRENKELKFQLTNCKNINDDLQNEVQYLKNVLANVDEISLLIRGIKDTPGLKLNSSLLKRRQDSNVNYPNAKMQKLVNNNTDDLNSSEASIHTLEKNRKDNSGICLHVGSGEISLEFCHHCNELVAEKMTYFLQTILFLSSTTFKCQGKRS